MDRDRERGFSLVELLVVIAIIGILATVVAVNVSRHVSEARIVKARADLVTLSASVEMYRMAARPLPASLDDLQAPLPPTMEPILRSVPSDPWGRPYLYEKTGPKAFRVRSLGADGVEGGEGEDADLSSEDKPA